MGKYRIWWHGTTNLKTVRNILRNGFKEETWFAKHLEDALEFGGRYVFAVVISFEEQGAYDWQVCCKNRISPDRILWFEKYTIERTHVNEQLKKEFFGSGNTSED